jgi:hypothetical protein
VGGAGCRALAILRSCSVWWTTVTKTLRIGWPSWLQSVAILRSCTSVRRGQRDRYGSVVRVDSQSQVVRSLRSSAPADESARKMT